jgi:hypothetical protein
MAEAQVRAMNNKASHDFVQRVNDESDFDFKTRFDKELRRAEKEVSNWRRTTLPDPKHKYLYSPEIVTEGLKSATLTKVDSWLSASRAYVDLVRKTKSVVAQFWILEAGRAFGASLHTVMEAAARWKKEVDGPVQAVLDEVAEEEYKDEEEQAGVFVLKLLSNLLFGPHATTAEHDLACPYFEGAPNFILSLMKTNKCSCLCYTSYVVAAAQEVQMPQVKYCGMEGHAVPAVLMTQNDALLFEAGYENNRNILLRWDTTRGQGLAKRLKARVPSLKRVLKLEKKARLCRFDGMYQLFSSFLRHLATKYPWKSENILESLFIVTYLFGALSELRRYLAELFVDLAARESFLSVRDAAREDYAYLSNEERETIKGHFAKAMPSLLSEEQTIELTFLVQSILMRQILFLRVFDQLAVYVQPRKVARLIPGVPEYWRYLLVFDADDRELHALIPSKRGFALRVPEDLARSNFLDEQFAEIREMLEENRTRYQGVYVVGDDTLATVRPRSDEVLLYITQKLTELTEK